MKRNWIFGVLLALIMGSNVIIFQNCAKSNEVVPDPNNKGTDAGGYKAYVSGHDPAKNTDFLTLKGVGLPPATTGLAQRPWLNVKCLGSLISYGTEYDGKDGAAPNDPNKRQINVSIAGSSTERTCLLTITANLRTEQTESFVVPASGDGSTTTMSFLQAFHATSEASSNTEYLTLKGLNFPAANETPGGNRSWLTLSCSPDSSTPINVNYETTYDGKDNAAPNDPTHRQVNIRIPNSAVARNCTAKATAAGTTVASQVFVVTGTGTKISVAGYFNQFDSVNFLEYLIVKGTGLPAAVSSVGDQRTWLKLKCDSIELPYEVVYDGVDGAAPSDTTKRQLNIRMPSTASIRSCTVTVNYNGNTATSAAFQLAARTAPMALTLAELNTFDTVNRIEYVVIKGNNLPVAETSTSSRSWLSLLCGGTSTAYETTYDGKDGNAQNDITKRQINIRLPSSISPRSCQARATKNAETSLSTPFNLKARMQFTVTPYSTPDTTVPEVYVTSIGANFPAGTTGSGVRSWLKLICNGVELPYQTTYDDKSGAAPDDPIQRQMNLKIGTTGAARNCFVKLTKDEDTLDSLVFVIPGT